MVRALRPILDTNQRITVVGNVFYTDRRRRIDLKKPIRDLIGQTLAQVNYCMEVCLYPEKIPERVVELTRQKIRPVLFYFVEKGKEDENEMS
jgi:hypothetical protein